MVAAGFLCLSGFLVGLVGRGLVSAGKGWGGITVADAGRSGAVVAGLGDVLAASGGATACACLLWDQCTGTWTHPVNSNGSSHAPDLAANLIRSEERRVGEESGRGRGPTA